ncbi:MAG: S41 family peptidase [Cytophagales bacterium]|nr:S41 family peptidase [Cytophagales bacterium]
MNFKLKVLILIMLLATPTWSFGQQLSKQSLIDDLTFLNESVSNGHPVNYDPQYQFNISEVIDRAKALNTDSISALNYTIWIEKGIYHIGCIHTSIQVNPLKVHYQPSFIPITTSIQKNNLNITSCQGASKIGQTIQKINGRHASEIIAYYEEYKASDGGTDAFSKEYFHLFSSSLISKFLGYPAHYEIETANETYVLKGQKKGYYRKSEDQATTDLLSNGSNELYLNDDFVILKVEDFNNSDKGFFKNAFKKIDEIDAENLIIDLRQNTGGSRKAAIVLTKFLADSAFAYSILQPKLSTGKYLNGKGKFFLFLSKLKYNVGNFYKMRFTDLGTSFRYAYKPKAKYHFNGNVYVLTDGFTASASTMVTSWLKQYSHAQFLGRQASGGYNGNNGGSFPVITLPQSKIQIRFPAYRLVLDDQSEMSAGLQPDVSLDTNSDIATIIKEIRK